MRRQGEANRSVMEKVQSGEIDRSEIRDTMRRNDKALSKAIEALLTSDQKAQAETLKGKTFVAQEQQPGG